MPCTSRRFAGFVLLAALAACSSDVTQPTLDPARQPVSAVVVTNVSPDISDGQGTAWRQLTETVGLTWNQVAQLCPRDGITPCYGTLGGIDLSGWVWATDEQVVQLIARYEPAILISRTLSGTQYAAGVASFFAVFQPSEVGGCSGTGYIFTCSFGTHVSGWSATSPAAGSAVSATIQAGFSAAPFISVVPEGSVSAASALRGLFLWRADGSGGTGIVANVDSGYVAAPSAGVAVENVLANDMLAGVQATTSSVVLTQVASSHVGVSLDVSDGSVRLAAGIRVGVETLRYRICERARLANCAAANVVVTINGNRVDAVDDAGASKTGGGTAIANVLANDTFAGSPAALPIVTLVTVSSDASMSLRADGAIIVSAGAAAGVHTLVYELCEAAITTNCDRATATVAVSAYAIDAADDRGAAPASPGGVAITSVLSNDTFDNAAATLANVSLTLMSSSAAGVTLDLSDGSVDVASGTPSGVQYLTYRICERANPGNCDQATATVTIIPQGYVISNDKHRINEGYGGSFSVRLLQPPAAVVTTRIAYLAGTMALTTNVTTLTFTPANWNTPQSVAFMTTRDSDKEDNAATLQLASTGIAMRYVVVNGLDTDRKATNPVTTIQAPFNGETVAGVVNFWGTATDSDGTLIDGKFYVDGVRIATATNAGGTFRAPGWNSATAANGWHTFELRVTDNGGNDGRMTIKVFVQN